MSPRGSLTVFLLEITMALVEDNAVFGPEWFDMGNSGKRRSGFEPRERRTNMIAARRTYQGKPDSAATIVALLSEYQELAS